MTDPMETLDQRLERLTEATAGVTSRTGFEDRVMQAVAAATPDGSSWSDWRAGILRVSPFVLTVAMVVVVVTVALAAQSRQAFDWEAAVAQGTVEVGW